MATIARLVTLIEAQMEGFDKVSTQLENTNKSLEGISSVAASVGKVMAGAFTVGAVVDFAKEIVSFASDMKDLSVQTGIGVERLQALNIIGAQSGVTVDMMASG